MTQAEKPKLPFGPRGELTEETIREAGLTGEEKKRADAMLEAQEAFLLILDHLSYPVDPDGHTHDLNHMEPTRMAVAWTLALAGFRRTGPIHIKKRAHPGPGMYQDAHTWVDARAGSAADELKPEHRSRDTRLPPDTRRLAAIRDGDEPVDRGTEWHTQPKVTRMFAPRPEDA